MPLGCYIADFFTLAVWLIVEVDDICYQRRFALDARLTKTLTRMGCAIVQIAAALVTRSTLVAVVRIREGIAASQLLEPKMFAPALLCCRLRSAFATLASIRCRLFRDETRRNFNQFQLSD